MLIYILNGPNLNLLGSREPEIYGYLTLDDIKNQCGACAKTLGLEIEFRQSNSEGQIIDWLHEAREKSQGIILNGGAYTHTCVAIHDALKSIKQPVIEVHLSNPVRREEFRHKSFIGMAATGTICGFGADSYELALQAMAKLTQR